MMLLSIGVVSETDITSTSQIVKFLFHYYFTIWASCKHRFRKSEMAAGHIGSGGLWARCVETAYRLVTTASAASSRAFTSSVVAASA